jgi:hypothetical protein
VQVAPHATFRLVKAIDWLIHLGGKSAKTAHLRIAHQGCCSSFQINLVEACGIAPLYREQRDGRVVTRFAGNDLEPAACRDVERAAIKC